LENGLFHEFQGQSALMNGKVPRKPTGSFLLPKPAQIVQVMADAEIAEKKDPALRLPRQAEHYSQIIGHFLAVKNSKVIAVSTQAHFARLKKYYCQLVLLNHKIEGDSQRGEIW
jgi:hypothetical protein